MILTSADPAAVSPETAALIAHLLAEDPAERVRAAAPVWLDHAVDAHPTDFWLRLLRAQFAGTDGLELLRKVEALQVAVALRPDGVDARLALGEALVDVGRRVEAAQSYRRVIEMTDNRRATRAAEGLARLETPYSPLPRSIDLPAPAAPAPGSPTGAFPPAGALTPQGIAPNAGFGEAPYASGVDTSPPLAAWARAAGLDRGVLNEEVVPLVLDRINVGSPLPAAPAPRAPDPAPEPNR